MSLLAVTSGSSGSSLVAPEGVDFDGVNDYLSRSSDLVGNVDSKTFTFSCWVYIGIPDTNNADLLSINNNTNTYTTQKVAFSVVGGTGSSLSFYTRRADTGAIGFQVYTPLEKDIASNTYMHLIISVDLNNTANRFVYLNDIPLAVSWLHYENTAINFSSADNIIHIANDQYRSNRFKGRLSNLFLDYTYRDLSIEANRRLFITADGKPTPTATLSALNPILYLPLKDSATATQNLGTGGNFTLNGTIATSERGANQDNCVASTFDGSADYLSRTSLTSVADGNQFTLSVNVKCTGTPADGIISFGTLNSSSVFYLSYESTGAIYLKGKNSSGTGILALLISEVNLVNYNITVSCDMSNNTMRHCYVNGKSVGTFSIYTNDILDFTGNDYAIGRYSHTTDSFLFNGNIGELYFDTKYIDLATNNPFWDSVENKPIPVRKVIADTGVTPLIAMPLDASNAGKNYGSGGDFVANSAPYIGSRGASEFWCRSILVDATKYLTYTGGLFCASLVKWVSTDSGVTWAVSYLNSVTVTNIGNGTDNGRVAYYFGTSEVINWALEVNTLRFTDGLGYPIQPTIDSNTLLYLPFDNISNLGYNMGKANDLTIVGSVVNSSDVKG